MKVWKFIVCVRATVCMCVYASTKIIYINLQSAVWQSRVVVHTMCTVCTDIESERVFVRYRYMKIYLNREIGNKQGKSNNKREIRKFISKSGAHKLCQRERRVVWITPENDYSLCTNVPTPTQTHFEYSDKKLSI